ncbi:Arginine exporter protein ArgO [Cronobacter condimenti 1330]|uniref:Arginine exporter protein ArgO n=1 Tax=Cronobacter condimenti 1330 TaxID=1073999 RepID=K7ZYY1_9ENTR|nr:Arginine exporter protein ArgO [Cronobacter condimenti 1330]
MQRVNFLFSGDCPWGSDDPAAWPAKCVCAESGIRRQYHLMIASLCALSDIVLICAGIFGGSAILMQSPWLLALVTWGGVAFLLWYGFGAFRTAMSGDPELASAEVMKQGRIRIITTMLAVTWLNPHVYLDTFVVLGSLGGQLDALPKRAFALGTISASIIWFFSLALLAAWLAPRLRTVRAQRTINLLVGLVMWFIAFQLARDGVNHLSALGH